VFVLVGLVGFIASAKMAIDPDTARVAMDHAQMDDLRNIIKKQVKRSMAPTIKLQTKDVKARKSDKGEVKHLESQVWPRPWRRRRRHDCCGGCSAGPEQGILAH